jgi:DNA-binding NarL/FixJ family response regulator
MRVVIADDHAMVRAGLRALLLSIPGVREVLEASDADEAIQVVAGHKPDVILMDITMPGMNGLQAMSRILANDSQTRVIIMSMHSGEEYVGRALQGGASGYLVKTAGLAELQRALMMVRRGLTYVSSSVKESMEHKYFDVEGGLFGRLTARHREVLSLISQGLKTWEIADRLGIHIKTVETHRAEVMNRLGVRTLAGLVRYAIRIGLVPLETAEMSTVGAVAAGD